ncbi:unnamed protein product [Lactuca saligna]|uniref:Uncharacterized protein n=1 Tax=Lactuca saligna TaxID=75948 RepID=A0AA35ZXG8_LACSI|nr:unnamed protein product [Lactuca saligna]
MSLKKNLICHSLLQEDGFAKIFLDQRIDCCSRNKRPVHVPYPRWLELIFLREEGYTESHGIIIPVDDLYITARIRKWIENHYVFESSYSEEDDNNDDARDELGYDKENSKADHHKEVGKVEDTDKDEDNPAADLGADFTKNMNSPPRKNKHIRFSFTSPTSDTEHHGSTTTIGDTTEPIIQDETSPTPSPSPQADTVHQTETVPPTPSPINVIVLHQGDQGESSSNFEAIVLSQLSLIM